MAKAAAPTLSAADAAALIMVTPRRLQQLASDGWIAKAARGRYGLADVVQGYVRSLKDEKRKGSKTAAADRISEARARKIEIEIEQAEHRLIDRDESLAAMEHILGMAAAELAGVPAQATRDVKLRREIERAINEVRDRAARRLAEVGAALRARGEAGDADPEAEP